jgi:hypothetical protein
MPASNERHQAQWTLCRPISVTVMLTEIPISSVETVDKILVRLLTAGETSPPTQA